jgi:hypothetical protein
MAESKSKRKGSSGSSGGSRSSSGSSGGSKSKRSSSSSSGGSKSKSSSSSGNKQQSAKELVRSAVSELQGLIGRPIEAVTGIEKNGSEWTVTVEVVELQRIPNTTDVLGVYEVTMNKDGELTGTRRTRRFYRSEAGDD